MGAQVTRNMVANALKRKTKQFRAEPEVKTSCVRVSVLSIPMVIISILPYIVGNWMKGLKLYKKILQENEGQLIAIRFAYMGGQL